MSKKGHPKNTKNKALHTKLMNRKKNKLKTSKNANKDRIKSIQRKYNQQLKSKEKLQNIKLICSDIDGTLLNDERTLSDKTIEEINRVNEIPFILISSRMPKAMVHLQEKLQVKNLPMIAYNGGLIIDNGKIIDTTEIAHQITVSICDFCKDTSIHTSLYHNDEWYVQSLDYWAKREENNTKVSPQIKAIDDTLKSWKSEKKGAHKIMCMGDEKEIDALVEFIDRNCTDEVIGYRSKNTYLEISHRAISKKTAIETLLKHKYPETKLENVLAFGDNYNDIEMLKYVGVGVAVENAKDEVLQIAHKITQHHKENGVANFIATNLK